MTLTHSPSASRAPGSLRMTPGRWVAVAFAVPVAIALIGWTAFDFVGLVANGSYPFSYAVPVQAGQVAVNLEGSNITLRQAPGAPRLTGTVQYGIFRPGLAESTENGTVTVGLSCDGIDSNCTMNAALGVPVGTAVSLDTGGGDVQTASFVGHLTLSTDGGNVNAGTLDGTLVIDTGGGDLTSNAVTGSTVQVSTEGGNIDAGDLAGGLRLDTGGGDLTSDVMSGGNLQISTEGGNVNANSVASPQVTIGSGGGDVTLVFTQPPSDLQITSEGGNVTVVLPHGDTRYDFTLQAAGGNVSYPSSLASPASRNTISVGSGGGDITITEAS